MADAGERGTPVAIVGVDGSDGSYRAVEFAAHRASQLGMGLVLAAVVPWSGFEYQTAEENERRSARKREELEYANETVLAPAVERCEKAGVPCETVATHGHPAETLADLAEERGAVQVLVGRTGDSRIKTVLFGSIPGTLVQMSPVPVTIVP